VLAPGEVEEVKAAGGTFIVSPNTDTEVIARAKALGLASWPGFFTATEAFAALSAGADGLKLFPASLAGPGGVKALKAVLPPTVPLYAVGGVGPENFADYAAAGTDGFGLGTNLYTAGDDVARIAARAAAIVEAADRVFGTRA